ncbi:MAG: MFS transporter [Alicyclobacillus sp.]|nr:MFS transporter [Alicyclobacillus sp.]MCL6516797.1 MFS transporter [Alicyclobacillus sp.]
MNATAQLSKGHLYTPHILMLVFTMMLSFLGFGFVMPLRALYASSSGLSSFDIGVMAGAASIAGFVASPFIGRLSDLFGARRVLTIALFLHSIVVLLYRDAHSPWSFILLRGCEGITSAGVAPPIRSLLNQTAPRGRLGEAFGLLDSARYAGILLGPAAGSFMASRFGYTGAFVCTATMLAFTGIVNLALMRQTRAVEPGPVRAVSLLPNLRTGHGSLYTLGLILPFPFGVAESVWSLYMLHRGASLPLIGLSYTAVAVPGLLLSSFIGRYTDRYGRKWPLIAGLLLSSIVFSMYALPLTPWWIIAISIPEGLANTICRTAASGLLADRLKDSPMSAQVQANYSAMGVAGNFIGAIIGGALFNTGIGIPFLVEGLLFAVTGGIVALRHFRLRNTALDAKHF